MWQGFFVVWFGLDTVTTQSPFFRWLLGYQSTAPAVPYCGIEPEWVVLCYGFITEINFAALLSVIIKSNASIIPSPLTSGVIYPVAKIDELL